MFKVFQIFTHYQFGKEGSDVLLHIVQKKKNINLMFKMKNQYVLQNCIPLYLRSKSKKNIEKKKMMELEYLKKSETRSVICKKRL